MGIHTLITTLHIEAEVCVESITAILDATRVHGILTEAAIEQEVAIFIICCCIRIVTVDVVASAGDAKRFFWNAYQ